MKFSNEVILKREEQVKNISVKGLRKVTLCSTQCVFFPGGKKTKQFTIQFTFIFVTCFIIWMIPGSLV